MGAPECTFVLLSELELLNESTVTLNVNLCKICEKVSSCTNHLKKTSSGVVVLVVLLEMLVKSLDTVGKKSYLYFGATRVTFVCCVFSNNLCFRFLVGNLKI